MSRPPLPPDQRRTIKVCVFLTPPEAAKIDAARGDVERAVWVREAAVKEARRVERGVARAAKAVRDAAVGPWVAFPSGLYRDFVRGDVAAAVGASGWYVYSFTGRIASGPETGPEGQRLADAALREARYVLEGDAP